MISRRRDKRRRKRGEGRERRGKEREERVRGPADTSFVTPQ